MNGKEMRNSIEDSLLHTAAYGGCNWSPRISSHADEIGKIWLQCGIDSEWRPLKSVLIHPPGPEYDLVTTPDEAQMLRSIEWKLAKEQHDRIAQAYHQFGVKTYYVEPLSFASPNLIFCADLFFMTPEGAILSRPASTVRAGEERWIARRLADLGVPIIRSLRGNAFFEGADAQWLDKHTVLIGHGLRTNEEGIRQISEVLNSMGIKTISIDLPVGTMHLMGILRFLDSNLVMIWPYRLAWKAVEILKNRGYRTLFVPDTQEAILNGALNFVTLRPRQILMAGGNPVTQNYLVSKGIQCHTLPMEELHKAAGGIGCLTGIIERELS